MNIYPDEAARKRLERAAEATGRSVEDLATSAVEEAALDWDKANGGLTKTDVDLEHPLKAGIDQSEHPDLHRHPLHQNVCTCLGMPGSDASCKVHA